MSTIVRKLLTHRFFGKNRGLVLQWIKNGEVIMNTFKLILFGALLVMSSHIFGAVGAGAGASTHGPHIGKDLLMEAGDADGTHEGIERILTVLTSEQQWDAISYTNRYGDTPLTLARTAKKIHALLTCLTPSLRFLAISHANRLGYTAFLLAARSGRTNMMTQLLAYLTPAERFFALSQTTNSGATALLHAVSMVNLATLEYLIMHGALHSISDDHLLKLARILEMKTPEEQAHIKTTINNALRSYVCKRRLPVVRAWVAARRRKVPRRAPTRTGLGRTVTSASRASDGVAPSPGALLPMLQPSPMNPGHNRCCCIQ